MSVAYSDEPRRGRPRFGVATKKCTICGEAGHQRNSPIHRPPGTPEVRHCTVCGETDHRANDARHAEARPPAPAIDPNGDVTPAVAMLRADPTRTHGKTIGAKPLTADEKRAAALVVLDDTDRPRTRGECQDGARPCPWISCSHHLYLDVNEDTGAIKINHPDKEPWELAETCALDVADRGSVTLEEVGDHMGIVRERVRQIEERSIRKLRRAAPELAEAGAAPLELACVDDRLRRR